MAKNDNLTDFLTDIADTIREKKGTTEKINPQDFSSEIKSIESGLPVAEENDVNFFDYDGTIRYSYTWEEAMALTELPPLPEHDGLICEGWCYTLEEIKSQEYPACDIAATYNTDNGETRFHIQAPEGGSVVLNITTDVEDSLSVDWGDGSGVEIVSEVGEVTVSHNYNKGKFIIKFLTLSGSPSLGHGTNTTPCFNGLGVLLVEANLSNINTRAYCFVDLKDLSKVTYPIGYYLDTGLFSNTGLRFYVINRTAHNIPGVAVLKNVVISPKTMFLSNGIIRSEYVTRVIIPTNNIISCGHQLCYATSITYMYIPDSIVRIDGSPFFDCKKLHRVRLSNNLTSLGSSFFYGCISLEYVDVPQTVASINTKAFYGCSVIKYINFENHLRVPELTNVDAFTNISTDCKIVVPDALYDEWIVATNWVDYADKIVKASEWTEPTNE